MAKLDIGLVLGPFVFPIGRRLLVGFYVYRAFKVPMDFRDDGVGLLLGGLR